MSTERESDGIGELTEDLLRIAILVGTRLAQRHAQQRANRLEQASQPVRAGARAGGAHPGARARRGPVLARWCALAGVVGSRRRRRHPQGVDDGARVAGTGSPRRRGGLSDGRRAAATATGWTCARPIPSVLGEQRQIPAHTTLSVDELVAYDQRVHEQLERLAEQRAQLAGDDPSRRPRRGAAPRSSCRSRRLS